jgi:hypothetical protein
LFQALKILFVMDQRGNRYGTLIGIHKRQRVLSRLEIQGKAMDFKQKQQWQKQKQSILIVVQHVWNQSQQS